MKVMLWSEGLDVCLTCRCPEFECIGMIKGLGDVPHKASICFRCTFEFKLSSYRSECVQEYHSPCKYLSRLSLREPYWDEFFVWIPEYGRLSKTQQKILEFLQKHRGQKFCLSDLMRKLGIPINSVKNSVRALWKRKLIRREFAGSKTLVWVE